MKAIYAGSFDPITNGHLDIIQRAYNLFDELIIVVAPNSTKETLFDEQERREMVVKSIPYDIRKTEKIVVKILPPNKMLVEFAQERKVHAMVRGLRPVQDFPNEFSLASINRSVHSQIETVMLITNPEVSFISSSMVKELAALKGPYQKYVPSYVAEILSKKLG